MGSQDEHGADAGALYVVATPIGHLDDITQRALKVLADVDLILAEDTRHSARLLSHYGIDRRPRRLRALHQHNERRLVDDLVARVRAGAQLALICDAGTPLISDPGFLLVRELRRRGLRVVPVPGPSAPICALSVSGLPTDRFCFEGFLPARAAARRRRLEGLRDDPRTLVILESAHRIVDSLADMVDTMGGDREAAISRELTKIYETIHSGPLRVLHQTLVQNPETVKGEFVIVMAGAAEGAGSGEDPRDERLMRALLAELPAKQAVAIAARATGRARNQLYRLAMRLEGGKP